MKRRFFKLTTLLADFSGLSCSCQFGDSVTTLHSDDILIHCMLDENAENIILQITVGILPFHNKDILFENLLKWNNEFSQAQGLSYAVLSDEKLIVLQGLISLRKIDDEYAYTVFTHFIREYMHSLELVEELLQDIALKA